MAIPREALVIGVSAEEGLGVSVQAGSAPEDRTVVVGALHACTRNALSLPPAFATALVNPQTP
jgi:hypothetical protein